MSEPDFGTMLGSAMYGALLVEHAKKCEECGRMLVTIHDHLRLVEREKEAPNG